MRADLLQKTRALSQRDLTFLNAVFSGDEAKAVEYAQVANIDVNAIAGEPLSVWFYRLAGAPDKASRYKDLSVQRIVFERFHQNPNPPNLDETNLWTFCAASIRTDMSDMRTAMFGTPEEKRAQQERRAALIKPAVDAMAAGFASLIKYGLRDKTIINEIFRGCIFRNGAGVDDDYVYKTVLVPMLRAGADINLHDLGGRRPIENAVEQIKPTLVANLVRDGAQLNYSVLHSGNGRVDPNEPCAPQRHRSLYGFIFNWARPNDPEPMLKIIATLASGGLSPMTPYGYMDNQGSGQCHFKSYYDAVVDTGNVHFAKAIKAAAEGTKPAVPTAQARLGAPSIPGPAVLGDWQAGTRSDGRVFASASVTSMAQGRGLKELQVECAPNGRVEFVVIPYGSDKLASLIPDDAEASQAARPFAIIANRITGPDADKLMRRLLAEESQAKLSGAGDSWTFAFYVNDPNAAGYSANLGGITKVRQHLLRFCKLPGQPSNQTSQSAPVQPSDKPH